MDFSQLFFFGGILTYVGAVVYLANQLDLGQTGRAASLVESPTMVRPNIELMDIWLRWLQYGLLCMMPVFGAYVILVSFQSDLPTTMSEIESQVQEIDMGGAFATLLLSIVLSVFGFLIITNDGIGLRVQNWLARLGGAYKSASRVHNSVILLMLASSALMVGVFVLEGGVSGIAQSIRDNGISAGDAVFQAFIQFAVTFLGVGFAIRRDTSQTFQRLGLRLPTTADVVWGVGTGIGFWMALLVVTMIWVSLTSPEILQDQTAAAEQLGLAFATLPLAFVLSISAAIGEEIWIRGGLQPVFGIFVTSIFFAILHIQVAFTPAMVIIFGLSLGLGWLRQRQSTVAAMIAHFCFNFVQLALLSLAAQAI